MSFGKFSQPRIVTVTVWVPVRINEVILIGSGLLVRIQSLWFSF